VEPNAYIKIKKMTLGINANLEIPPSAVLIVSEK